jgi:uncharacterized protein YecE (DUF72 family)
MAAARATTLRIGTSGFSYPAWRGPFYPDDLPADRMLGFYGTVFSTVEINNTFYRMPTTRLLAGWRAQTPATFRFAIKAPQHITHRLRLRDAGSVTADLVRLTGTLGRRRGPLLFQLPPYLRCDLERLDTFLRGMPFGAQVVFEFRHPSWFSDETYEVLRTHRAALCVADTEEGATPFVETAAFGYLRLRRPDYDSAALGAWVDRLRNATRWKQTFVFFKHDDAGRAAELAQRFATLTAN